MAGPCDGIPYNEDVYNLVDPVRTLQQRIECNYKFLRENFYSEAGGPASPHIGEVWADAGSGYLRVYNENSEWKSIIDLKDVEGKIALKTGQVVASDIDDDAVKPSLVSGASISPASCTLRAKPLLLSIPTRSDSDPRYGITTLAPYVPEAFATYKVWVPDGLSKLYMRCEGAVDTLAAATMTVYFQLQGFNSTSHDFNNPVNLGYEWIDEADELELDISVVSGWSDLIIYGSFPQSGKGGRIRGLSFRSD